MNLNIKKIKTCIFSKNHIFYFIIFAIIYFFLTLYINGQIGVNNIFLAAQYDINLKIVLIVTFINSLLFSLAMNLIIYRYREVKSFGKKEKFLTSIATFIGFIFAGCPSCAVGIIPFIFASFGIYNGFILNSTFFNIVQILSIFLFLIAIYFLQKDLVCKIKKKKK